MEIVEAAVSAAGDAGGTPATTALPHRHAPDFRSSTGCFDWLESFLQLDVPEPAVDRGKRCVIATRASCKRRVFVEHVLHSKEIVVLFNEARHSLGLYSAVDTGRTFLSLPPFILKFFL